MIPLDKAISKYLYVIGMKKQASSKPYIEAFKKTLYDKEKLCSKK